MNVDEMIASLTPEVYQRLVTAVETGKWADGVGLTPQQKENSLQLVMLWQARHNQHPEHMSVGKGGEMVIKTKKQLKEELGITDGCVTQIKLQ